MAAIAQIETPSRAGHTIGGLLWVDHAIYRAEHGDEITILTIRKGDPKGDILFRAPFTPEIARDFSTIARMLNSKINVDALLPRIEA
ncbi:hypothetical protein [Microvirga solisilvae]|uniref:hypothetical protein n=1 Tax=Microvirga solisilvae TaxID=2919498 RepID=UPI001FAF3383|nr:hypothetical protein [Microvirga solisilvae]